MGASLLILPQCTPASLLQKILGRLVIERQVTQAQFTVVGFEQIAARLRALASAIASGLPFSRSGRFHGQIFPMSLQIERGLPFRYFGSKWTSLEEYSVRPVPSGGKASVPVGDLQCVAGWAYPQRHRAAHGGALGGLPKRSYDSASASCPRYNKKETGHKHPSATFVVNERLRAEVAGRGLWPNGHRPS
jgi:hypothetical protein